MRIFSRSTLSRYWANHPQAEEPLRRWFHQADGAEWQSPADIKDYFASASFIGSNRVVFNIAGNKYRLICQVDYEFGVAKVLFLGTHREYDNIDVATITYIGK